MKNDPQKNSQDSQSNLQNDLQNTPLGIFPKSWTIKNAGRVPGNIPIWVGILSELTEFGIFFVAYFVAKFYYPEVFAQGPQSLHTLLGVINTVVLLSSSYFMAKAMSYIRLDDNKRCERNLWLAVSCGGLYLLIKAWEFHWNSLQGFSVNTSEFFTVYYYMTINHFLHVGWASCAILWVIYRLRSNAYSSTNNSGLEALAVYWHMIDLMWILIFPLLYVLR